MPNSAGKCLVLTRVLGNSLLALGNASPSSQGTRKHNFISVSCFLVDSVSENRPAQPGKRPISRTTARIASLMAPLDAERFVAY